MQGAGCNLLVISNQSPLLADVFDSSYQIGIRGVWLIDDRGAAVRGMMCCDIWQ